MARPLRVQFAQACYHVTARGNERREIFRDDADRSKFLLTLSQACQRFGLVVHAYCLMPNHYHLLVRTPRGNLSRSVGWVQAAYAMRFNRRHGRCGHLVQGRFKAHLVEADAYAKDLVRYVHLNPVRPRHRRQPVPVEREAELAGYRWSSHRVYAGLAGKAEAPDWLSTEWLSYWDDGSGKVSRARRAYADDIGSCFGRPIPNPLEQARGGLVLGDEGLWRKAMRLLSASSHSDELRWVRRQDQDELRRNVAALVAKQTDPRLRVWARVQLGGERISDLARELGYADASGVAQVVRRLETATQTDRTLRRTMDRLRAEMSNVKS